MSSATHWIEVHPGVTKYKSTWADSYRGTGDALVASGLALPAQLPGQPTSGRTMAGFLSDGSRVRQGDNHAWKQPGYKHIRKIGRTRFEVVVRVDPEEENRRQQAKARSEEQSRLWASREREAQALVASMQRQPSRGHLRLVWSAP